MPRISWATPKTYSRSSRSNCLTEIMSLPYQGAVRWSPNGRYGLVWFVGINLSPCQFVIARGLLRYNDARNDIKFFEDRDSICLLQIPFNHIFTASIFLRSDTRTGKVNTISIRLLFPLFLIFMSMSVMDIGHMTMLVFFSEMFMLM